MKKGTLILICGLPGSGKTTLAKKLEKERMAIRFCADQWIIAILDRRENVKEIDRLRNPVEQKLWKTTQKLLQLGVNVILENGFWNRKERELYRQKASELGSQVELYFLDAPLEVLWQRVSERNKKIDDDSFELSQETIEKWYKDFEKPTQEEGNAYNFFNIKKE